MIDRCRTGSNLCVKSIRSPEDARKDFVLKAWATLGGTERFIFNKLITGGFRVGISQKTDDPRLGARHR